MTGKTETLVSVIVFVVDNHHKHLKYPGREFNHGHCLSLKYFFSGYIPLCPCTCVMLYQINLEASHHVGSKISSDARNRARSSGIYKCVGQLLDYLHVCNYLLFQYEY